MKNEAIGEKILALFRNNGNSPLSYNELVWQLKLVKKEKSLLAETLQAMISDGAVAKQNRKFRLIKTATASDERSQATQPALSVKLIEGIFDATPLAKNQSYAFIRTEKGDFFVSAEDTLNAYHGDRVAIEPHFRRSKSDYARVRRIIQRANPILAGDLRSSGPRWLFISSNHKIHNWFEVADSGQAREGDKVVLEVLNWGNPLQGKMPVGKVIEVLGPSGDPQVELMAVIRQYQLPLDFPEAAQAEAQSFPERIPTNEIERRDDLRDIFTFTIDPASAKDFDDAISLIKTPQGWRLYVHIADVAHYVKPGGPLWEEAVKRGNSFYFPKKVIPMLPEIVSNRICSLRPDEDKLTLTVITDFDAKGRIYNQRMTESVIRSDSRLSYDEVDALFLGQNVDFSTELTDTLNEARKLSALLTKKRLAQGYIFFDLPELEYEYDDEGLIRRFTLAEETESHKLIENFMLVANEYAATKLTALAPASLYRIHEDPDPQKLEKVVLLLSHYGVSYYDRGSLNESVQYLLQTMPSLEHHKVFDRLILRRLKKAKYSVQHIRHFGLGMETYTHFTSPIRRICDLVIHHLCKTCLIKSQKLKFSLSQLKQLASIASEQELQADQAERDIERVYSLAYMKKQVGEKFGGLVISAKAAGLIVMLDSIPVTGMLSTEQFPSGNWTWLDREMRFVNRRNNDYYQLLDHVLVQIMEVSDDIYLELQQTSVAHRHYQLPASTKSKLKSSGTSNRANRTQPRNAVDDKSKPKKAGSKNRQGRRRR